MTTAEYVIACRKDEIIQCPTKIEDVEDLGKLYIGLNASIDYAYDYIEKFPKANYKSMSQLRDAVDTINFCTAQLSSVKIAYNDLVNKILSHNEDILNTKKS